MCVLLCTEDFLLGLLSVFIRKECQIFIGIFLSMIDRDVKFLSPLQLCVLGSQPVLCNPFLRCRGRSDGVLWVGSGSGRALNSFLNVCCCSSLKLSALGSSFMDGLSLCLTSLTSSGQMYWPGPVHTL